MASKTTKLKLHKIDLTDAPPDITVLNQNWDRIDEMSAEDVDAYPNYGTVENVDLNTLIGTGIYQVNLTAESGNKTAYHSPTDVVSWIELFVAGNGANQNGGRIVQIAYLPYSHQKRAYWRFNHDGTWSDWVRIATIDTVLMLDGSNTMTGALGVNGNYGNLNANATRAQLRFNPIPGDTTQATSIGIYDGRNGLTSIAKLFAVVNGQENSYDILHTGNKPSGSYTGNGSTTQRKITMGGLTNNASMCVIHNGYSGETIALVTKGGAILKQNTELTALKRDVARFENGELIISSNHIALNASSAGYYYQVL